MDETLRVLMVEDSADDVVILERVLVNGGFNVLKHHVIYKDEFVEQLKNQQWDVIISDYVIPDFGGIEALQIVSDMGIDVPFIIVSGMVDEETAVCAMKAGAHDFISKSNLCRLIPVVQRELAEAQVRFKQRVAEGESRRNEQKYRHLAESITDVFFALDTSLCCTYWNRAAEKLTGISVKSALTKPFQKLFPEENGKEIEEALRDSLENREKTAISFVMETDTVRHYEMNIYPTESGLSVLARDISFRKKADALMKTHEEMTSQLAQAQELKLLGNLTSGVAHEVRNPLNAISVVLEALFQDIGDIPEYRLYKEHLFTHVDRLKRLMQDLLQLGRPIERSKVTIFDIEDLVSETIDVWRTSGPHHHFSIGIERNGGFDLQVKGDPLKVQQVFMNLLENASQHSTTEKVIVITFSGCENSCEVKISDRGSGIKPDHLSKIFDPFFTTRKRGTGLGLSIVKHIVDVHGGAITIENNQNTPGCTVTVLFPRVQKHKKYVQKDSTEIEHGCMTSYVV